MKFKKLRILYNRKAVLLNSLSPQCVYMNTLIQAMDTSVLWVLGAIENKNNMLGGKKASKQILFKISVTLCVYMCVYTKEINKRMLFIPLADIIEYHVPGTVLSVRFTNVINEKTYFLGEISLEL